MIQTNVLEAPNNKALQIKEARDSDYYLIFVTVLVSSFGEHDVKDIQTLIRNVLSMIHHKKLDYHFILDISSLTQPRFADLYAIHQVMVEDNGLIRDHLQSTTVTCGPVVRNIASAILKICPPKNPVKFFDSSTDKEVLHTQILEFVRKNRR